MVRVSAGLVWAVKRILHQGRVCFVEFTHPLRISSQVRMVLLGKGLELAPDCLAVRVVGQTQRVEMASAFTKKGPVVRTVKAGIAKALPVKPVPVFPAIGRDGQGRGELAHQAIKSPR